MWLAAGVHANEPSGTDADLRVLRDLASGEHCEQLRRLVVVVVPVQNPDGRVAGTRTNAYGFDLNRDWFAATQPETVGKLALMARLPPVAVADQHEMDGTGFFFPPNADPIHHEIPSAALAAIDRTVARPLAAAFGERGIDFTTHATFDLFFMGYADTVAATLFGAAGLTFEKGGASPWAQRVAEHGLAARTLLAAVARDHTALLRGWAAQWRRARAEGERGSLEPNVVVEPRHRVRFEVPERPVHAYLLRADAHAADAAALVARLRAVGVQVARLARETRIERFRAYGSAQPAPATLPAGTWVVPMAQARKHWVQAMLGQDAYVPFPYFYDVSSWSNPLLMGLSGGWAEEQLAPDAIVDGDPPEQGAPADGAVTFAGDSSAALGLAFDLLARGAEVTRVPGEGTVQARGLPGDVVAALAGARRVPLTAAGAEAGVTLPSPRVALLADLAPLVKGRAGHENSALHESHGWTRFVLERRFGLEVDVLGDAAISGGRLGDGGYTALVVPDGSIPEGALSRGALAGIQAFVRGGGTYVGIRTLGLQVARAARIATVSERAVPASFQSPGATFAVEVDASSPLGWGAGGAGFHFNAGDPVLEPGGGTAVVRYPSGGGFVSGYVEHVEPLRGTPALVDAAFGAGRVALFAGDPSFRAYVEGGQRLLANALLAPPPAAAVRSGRAPSSPPEPGRLGAEPPPVTVRLAGGRTVELANPLGLPADELPALDALLAAGERPEAVFSP